MGEEELEDGYRRRQDKLFQKGGEENGLKQHWSSCRSILTKGVRFTLDLVLGDEGAALNPKKTSDVSEFYIFQIKTKNYILRTFSYVF